MVIRARFVVPVDVPPIENGAVSFDDGRITGVGPAARFAGAVATVDYGDAVILPGLVNAHTHLELTSFAGLVPPSSDFTGWLQRLFAERRVRLSTPDAVQESVRAGIDGSVRAGVTTIGDITAAPGWTREVLAGSSIRAVSFGEVIAVGTIRDALLIRLDAAADREFETDRLRVAISPHAPYTLEPDGLRACVERAGRDRLRLCMHLAETRHEDDFTRHLRGPLAEHLRRLSVWDDSILRSGCSPVDLAERTGLLSPATLLAHANYVGDEDIERIARSGASVVYCPRTHHAFGHAPHRFRDMLTAGVNVCIGTDSLASNPSLSIMDELRFLHRLEPQFPVAELLAMATTRAARALGLDDEIGSVTVGKSADLSIWPCNAVGPSGLDGRRFTQVDAILDGPDEPLAVYVQGRLQFASGLGG